MSGLVVDPVAPGVERAGRAPGARSRARRAAPHGHNRVVVTTSGPGRMARMADPAALAAAWAVSSGLLAVAPDEPGAGVVGVTLATLAAGLLVVGHRFPRSVLVAVGALDVAALSITSSPPALRLLLAVALYRFVRQADGRRGALTFAVGVAVAVAGGGAWAGDDKFWFEWATDAAVLVLPIAAADARRANLRRRTEAIEREVAEHLHAERLRIANDLHDIVAHSLSAIAVQSGIAAHVFDREPAVAREALVEINLAGRRALDELRTLLGVLRSPESAPLRPVPTDPGGLAEVVAGAAGDLTGVEVAVDGAYPGDVAESTVVAVHRIVHEALVNVARHAGDVPTRVALTHGGEGVRVVVANDAPTVRPASVPSTGVGLLGIREWVGVLGGWVHAGETAAGGFTVDAFVPYHQRAAAASR